MQTNDDHVSELLSRAAEGSSYATQRLMQEHRKRLRRMIQSRLDPRLSARLDPSDVVQDVLLSATSKLADYVQAPAVPFYVWLRQIAWDRLSEIYRQHVRVEKRSVSREAVEQARVSDESVDMLVQKLPSRELSPSETMLKSEARRRMRAALRRLPNSDRELLLMRYVEQMKLAEIGAQLQLGLSATKSRHLRALDRLATLIESVDEKKDTTDSGDEGGSYGG